MKIQTLSVLVGSRACNAKCPFCVSSMTPNGDHMKPRLVNWRNLDIACRLASKAGATTAMITGKGEPMLWPDLVEKTVAKVSAYFPLVEIQTNGITLSTGLHDKLLYDLYSAGVTTIAVSVVHWDRAVNAKIYGGDHFEIPDLVGKLHEIGFSVRLCTTMAEGFVDKRTVLQMISKAKEWEIDQLTLTPVSKPDTTAALSGAKVKAKASHEVSRTLEWVESHYVWIGEVRDVVSSHGDSIMSLPHGAEVFDVEGQNVCVNNCLRRQTGQEIRNLIFHPDGHLRTDWTHQGSIIL